MLFLGLKKNINNLSASDVSRLMTVDKEKRHKVLKYTLCT